MTERQFRLTPVNPLEQDRLNGIINYLKLEQRVKLFWRTNGGGRPVKGGFIWFYKLFVGRKEMKGRGLPDIVGMLRDGRILAIEVKRPGEQPTEEQAEFLALVLEAGGVSVVAHNWQQVKAILIEGE